MGKLATKKIKSTTILETLVALTISVFLFLMVTVLFVQVTGRSVSIKKIRAHELLNNYSLETSEQKSYYDEERAAEEFILKRQVSAVDSLPGIIRIKFLIYEGNTQLLDQIDKLVLDEKTVLGEEDKIIHNR
jgi:hypothetical protein